MRQKAAHHRHRRRPPNRPQPAHHTSEATLRLTQAYGSVPVRQAHAVNVRNSCTAPVSQSRQRPRRSANVSPTTVWSIPRAGARVGRLPLESKVGRTSHQLLLLVSLNPWPRALSLFGPSAPTSARVRLCTLHHSKSRPSGPVTPYVTQSIIMLPSLYFSRTLS